MVRSHFRRKLYPSREDKASIRKEAKGNDSVFVKLCEELVKGRALEMMETGSYVCAEVQREVWLFAPFEIALIAF